MGAELNNRSFYRQRTLLDSSTKKFRNLKNCLYKSISKKLNKCIVKAIRGKNESDHT